MGRATRWLKGLFGIKNNNNPDRPSSDEPKRRSTDGPCYNGDIETSLSEVAELAALRRPPYYYCSEKQSKYSMAVAAAADAALAAARAAVAVVRLTGHGSSTALIGPTRCENAAAVMIQTVFRGYLARKALRALKGVVKLQAIIRGHLVRKQAILTLKSMQSLIRFQSATRRSHRAAIINPIDHQTRSYTSSMVKFGGAPQTRRQPSSSIPPRPLAESINGRRNSPSHRRSSGVTSLVDFTNSPNCYQTAHSPLPSHFSGYNISTPSHFNFLQELYYDEEFRRCSSTQTTPRFDNVFRQRSEHGGFVSPSYMANTQSFSAKARSSSVPKQRSSGGISSVSLNEMMESSRSSFSEVRMLRS